MQPATQPVPQLATPSATDRPSRFPLFFEALVWSLYVGLFKYNYYLEPASRLFAHSRENFPYPQLILFALVATLYALPYYRWLLPKLLTRRHYGRLALLSLPYLWLGIKLNAGLAAALFAPLAAPPALAGFYQQLTEQNLGHLFERSAPYALLFTDLLAFSCVGFVRVAFEQEARRRAAERDHLALQLEQLKAQLQPHFLFNTLNSIYGLSLAGSPDTPRFILLLSELMRYVLYDSGKDYVALTEEVAFLENYFEMEQRKYAGASIRFAVVEADGANSTNHAAWAGLHVPPLLLLPLVENSFKHGRHHFTDAACVKATLSVSPGALRFVIENDMLPAMPVGSAVAAGVEPGRRSGGIGLVNIRRRLQLYYPGRHALQVSEHAGRYRAELTLQL